METNFWKCFCLSKGNYNLARIRRGMKGSNEWEMYHSTKDPGETTDLKEELPEVFEELIEAKDLNILKNMMYYL